MAVLKTPLTIRERIGFSMVMLAERDGVCICECTRDAAQFLHDAVNRDAEHAETVRKLTEQRDALLAACRLCVASWDMSRDHRATYEAYSVSANRAEDAARAAIATAEGSKA